MRSTSRSDVSERSKNRCSSTRTSSQPWASSPSDRLWAAASSRRSASAKRRYTTATSLDSFTLLAIPLFVLAGELMNHGGSARRLIDLARWLLNEGIQSMSLNPDSVIETWMFLAGESV